MREPISEPMWGKKLGDQTVPFDQDGNQMHYLNPYWARESTTWKPNETFTDTLTYSTYHRGRSAAYFEFTRSAGRRVYVFMADLEPLIKWMVCGKVTGTFTFCKRGANYGCRMVVEE